MYNSPEFSLLSDDTDAQNPPIDCKIFDPDDLTDLNNHRNNDKLSIFHTNIRSCRRNFAALQSFLNNSLVYFTIIVLTEIWLEAEIDYGFDLVGYTAYNLYRNSHGGGIKIFVDERISTQINEKATFINDFFEILTVTVALDNTIFNVSGIYKPPNSNIKDFTESFYNYFISKIPFNCKYILAGDFNVNILNPLKHVSIDNFIQTMMGDGFMMYITRATKYNPNNVITEYALIDHIWFNFRPIDMRTGVILTCLTDHFSIFADFKTKVSNIVEKIKFRDYSDRNKINFINKVNHFNFNIDSRSPAHLNSSFNLFYNNFFKIFNSSMPIKCKTRKYGSYAPWMTPDLKFCIRLSRDSFDEYNSILKITIKQAKELFYHRKFMQNNGNIKKTWSLINNLLRKKKCQKRDIP